MRKNRGITTYSGAHRNVTLHRGQASQQQCECGATAAEWAYIHGSVIPELVDRGMAFSIDPQDYMPMCLRCHRVYDKSTITHCPNNHPYSGDNLIIDGGKRKCRTCVYRRNTLRRRLLGLSEAQKIRKLELQRARRLAAKEAAA